MSITANVLPSSPERNGSSPRKYLDLDHERQSIVGRLSSMRPNTEDYATEFVDSLLDFARRVGTSDIHLQPTRTGLEVRFRSNGVLQLLGAFPLGANSSIISRLKVLANLLTYQADVPQEGRVASPKDGTEIRVSTFPTLHGERAVMRFFGHGDEFTSLDQLGHTQKVTEQLRDTLRETSGAFLVTGPAGSGKSTTLYACLRYLVNSTNGARSLVSIEDPIEVPIDGVAQSQVNVAGGFDLKTGLRSLMRQDPEVIMVGEIRDRETAEIAIQASLTGQLLLTTFHADSTATAISRLIEMGIEPFLVRSGLIAVMSQRLLRLLCTCSRESRDHTDFCDLANIEVVRVPTGCARCNDTGFQSRAIISEFLDLRNANLAHAILNKGDSREIYRIAREGGMSTLLEQATDMVRQGRTSPLEVRRLLGSAVRL